MPTAELSMARLASSERFVRPYVAQLDFLKFAEIVFHYDSPLRWYFLIYLQEARSL